MKIPMLKKSPSQSLQPLAKPPETPKSIHPKILLIDTSPAIKSTLTRDGYNVLTGTFGTPYKVQRDAGYQPVVSGASIPYFTEQEIVVIDLATNMLQGTPPGEKKTPLTELDWWAKCSHGVIDPRPRAMATAQQNFDRILNNGGVFIVFSDAPDEQEYVSGKLDRFDRFEIDQEIKHNIWSFLGVLNHLMVISDHGEHIEAVNEITPIVQLFSQHLPGASFSCTFQAIYSLTNRWEILARSKFRSPVAGVILPREDSTDGFVFVLPNIKQKELFLSAFLKDVLPELCPNLFPDAEGQKWVHRNEYELPSVLKKSEKISAIKQRAAQEITAEENLIKADQQANSFLYDLIRATGASLVDAIKKSLAQLGFNEVIDVDEEMKNAGTNAPLREDLRIHDCDPILVVDIKGVAGRPADGHAQQSQKHAFMYMQQHSRTDVRPLAIINHQRLLPPLDRENDMPFRQEILDFAEQVKLGLMTAWDLFRLVRNFTNHQWTPAQVKPIFYRVGRISPIPEHYEFVGVVKRVWKSAYSVQLEQDEIRTGDKLAIEFPVDFDEQLLLSMKLNDLEVEVASSGSEVGIQRNESLPKVRTGMRVYRIRAASTT